MDPNRTIGISPQGESTYIMAGGEHGAEPPGRHGPTVGSADRVVPVSGLCTHPPCPAVARMLDLYRRAAEESGADARVAPDLPELFDEAGLLDVDLVTLQPAFREGDGKQLPLLAFDSIRAAIVAGGVAGDGEMQELRDELEAFIADSRTIVSAPRIFQVTGRRPE